MEQWPDIAVSLSKDFRAMGLRPKDHEVLAVRVATYIILVKRLSSQLIQRLRNYPIPKPVGRRYEKLLVTIHPLPSTANFRIPTAGASSPPSIPISDNDDDDNDNDIPNIASLPENASAIRTTHTETNTAQAPSIDPNSCWAVVRRKYEGLPTHVTGQNKIKNLATWVARNPLQENYTYSGNRKEFNPQRRGNIRSALLQVAGIPRNQDAQCSRCRDGKGKWDLCVVAPSKEIARGACANCSYNGKNKECSFYNQDVGRQNPPLSWSFKATVILEVNASTCTLLGTKMIMEFDDEWTLDITLDDITTILSTEVPHIRPPETYSILADALTKHPPPSSPKPLPPST